MQVIFHAHQKLGNLVYKKGQHNLPDHTAHNRAFHALVQSGAAQILPRDAAQEMIQMSRDAKAVQNAEASRKASKSALAASSATPTTSSAAGSVQALPTPAQPILARATVVASEPVALATAQEDDED